MLKLCCFACCFAMSFGHAEVRTWTNSAGKTLKAELLKKDDDKVTLKLENGRNSVLKISDLSESDQEYVEAWEPEEKDAKKEKEGDDAKKGLKFKWNKTEKSAFKQAKEEKLPVMILFTGTSWCGYCVKLESEVLKKKEFSEGMNGVAIGLICISESPGNYKGTWAANLAKKYGVKGVPSIIVVDDEGKVLGTMGYYPGEKPAYYVNKVKGMKK